MKRNTRFNLLMILGLVLALSSGISMTRRALAQEPGPEGQSSILAAVGTAFTYQGRLEDASGPVDGNCDFKFSLWDAASVGSQVGSTQTKTNVAVDDGYFSAPLDFGSSAFEGDARWLAISVACPAGGSYTTLIGRVALTAAPYAHSLRPGAVIEGSVSTVLKVQTSAGGMATALLGHASSQTGQSNGVYGSTESREGGAGVVGRGEATTGKAYGVAGVSFAPNGSGVYGQAPTTGTVGIATSGSGPTWGVYGKSDAPGGYGVYGENTSGSGVNYGVYGKTSSPDGYGIYAQNTASGIGFDEPTAIRGEVNAANGFAVMGVNDSGRGVYGEGTGRYGVGGFSDTSFGVFGKSSSGPGVAGEAGTTGTKGTATATSGYAVGVYGKSVSSAGYGGHFVNMYTDVANENAVGMWAGSYFGDVIQGHELDSSGDSMDRVFRVLRSGDVYIDGTYYNTGADFAEMLPAADGLEPGDVLVIGPDGQLARSSEAYQPTVVGVYSTKPAFVGGSDEDMENPDKAPLAIVGIVPVKASAENGPIAPGDLLVASSIPGYAMKAGPNPPLGTVIGKALAGLESGVGVIQLLVTLQ